MAIKRGDTSYLLNNKPKPYKLLYEGINGILAFPIPPNQVSYAFPERVVPTQTLHGNHFDDWGEGIIGIQIAGSFGWGVDKETNMTGKMTMAKLGLLWEQRAMAVKKDDPDKYPIHFIDTQRNCYFLCVSPDLRIDQSVQSPQKQTYQMTFQVIQRISLFGGITEGGSLASYQTSDIFTNQITQNANGLNTVFHDLIQTSPSIASSVQTSSLPQNVGVPPLVSQLPLTQTSLAEISQAIYHSQNSAYIDSLRKENALSHQNINRPQNLPFVRFLPRNAIEDAPFDGSIS